MIRIGLDTMGGDFAPEAILAGAKLALYALPEDVKIVLIGNGELIDDYISRHNIPYEAFEIVHAPEIIKMGDHPTHAFTRKHNSSMAKGFRLLAHKKIDAFASAGNTGAMLVGTTMTVKTIPGIIRPTIATTLPNIYTGQTIILDVGITPDSKPDVLYQYGLLGSLYARHVYKIRKPRVALLNIGSEPTKGNLVTRSTYEMMKETKEFYFIGNIESNEFFTKDKADVIVCDGFVGNVVIKEAETLYTIAKKRNIHDEFLDRFNFENYGGTPILGVNGNVIIAHGISNEKAIKTMLLHTLDIVRANLVEQIKNIFKL